MAAVVNIAWVAVGSASNTTGVFSGQNMQNDWDSHTTALSTLGGMLGNRCLQAASCAVLWSNMTVGQPLLDQDVKANNSGMVIGV